MRAITLGTCLTIALFGAPTSAQVPDIRGLTFEASVDLVIDCVVQEESFHFQSGMQALPALPHSFEILPDAAAPMDPTRIVIRTRLPIGPDDVHEVRFELQGLYDPMSGEIEAAGIAQGLYFWQTPFATDGFGQLDSLANVWLQMTDPMMTLHAIVPASITDSQVMGFDIVGGYTLGPYHAAATLELNAQRIAWLPSGTDDVALTLVGPYLVEDVTAFYDTLYAQVVDVFGDVTNDLLLTQADVIEIHKMFGPILDGDFDADLTADGLVSVQDADLLQWLVRCIGNKDLVAEPVLQGSAAKDGKTSKQAPILGNP